MPRIDKTRAPIATRTIASRMPVVSFRASLSRFCEQCACRFAKLLKSSALKGYSKSFPKSYEFKANEMRMRESSCLLRRDVCAAASANDAARVTRSAEVRKEGLHGNAHA